MSLFLARVPVESAPARLLVRHAVSLGRDWRARADADHAHLVGALVAEGEAGRQPPPLGPGEVGHEARGLPGAHLHAPPVARARGVPPEEGQVPPAQAEAHGALEAPAGCRRVQRLDVRPLDLPRRLADLPLADHRAGVGAKRHAAAAPGLKVNDREADIVGVRQHLHLQVHVAAAAGIEDVGSEPASAVCDLVCLLDRCYLRTGKGCAEGRHLVSKATVAALPVNAGEFPAADHQLTACAVEVENTVTVQLQAEERVQTQLIPGATVSPIQLPELSAGSIHTAQAFCVQAFGNEEIRPLSELGQGALGCCNVQSALTQLLSQEVVTGTRALSSA
mmetsp:Transcript_98834/g.279964  ORF Transcript_98834/g.279964 Transcript_98834/m.279964 type:complete len:335 (+) Transcript_98834:493-1497(+)